MTSKALEDFMDDCFTGNDPICDLHLEDSIWLDNYISTLTVENNGLIEDI